MINTKNMNFKYVHNYLGGDSATIRLYNEIYFGTGTDICNELVYLSQIGVKKINMRINSVGGSVIDGQSIISCMRELNESGVEVNTYVDYMAASIAGVIAMYGKKRYIVSNGLFMMHDPSGGSNDAKGIEVLSLIKETLAEQLATASGKKIDDIKTMMSFETWMNASDAIKNGFFDAVFDSLVKVPAATNYLTAFQISNSILLKSDIKMDKIINKLGLAAAASQEDVVDEIAKIQNSFDTEKAELEQKVEELKKQNESLQKAVDEFNEQNAINLVENAIKEGKIKAEAKVIFVENAKKDFNLVKSTLDGIQVQAMRFSNVTNSAVKNEDDRSEWTFNDWRKKDSEGLINLKKTDIEKYNEILNKK